MKSILLIYGGLCNQAVGGVQRKILSISEYLYARRLFFPILITSFSDGMFADQFRRIGSKVYSIKDLQGNTSTAAEQISRIAKKHDISLIQSHGFRESVVARKVKRWNGNFRHIFRVHTLFEGAVIPKWKKFLYHYINKITSKEVDAFVPISIALEKELIEKSKIDPCRIRVVPNGISALGPPDPENTTENFLTPAVAIIGDLQERKQQHLAVEAIGLLCSKGLKINLHLIGADINNYASRIRRVAYKNGVENLVHIHGQQPQEKIANCILQNVSVVILPSLFEGVPTSIIEGMSLRKLVVTTPVGGTDELVRDGVNGLLHPPRDVHALAKILEKVFTTPAKEWENIRNAGYETWKKKFSLDQMMDGLIKIYRDLDLIEQQQLV